MSNVGDRARQKIGRSRGTSSSNSYNMRKQASNYQTRFKNVGINPEEVTDKRNWLEKALNLEPDQNFLFDIFEVLGRPQNALFTGITNAQEGGSFGEGLLEGIKGETKTSGKDILLNAGMEDTEGQLDLADILGFGLDVFADPIDLALIPVTAGGSVAAKAGASGAIKGAKALNTATDIAKGAKALDTATDIAKGVNAASDVTKATKWISPSEALFKGAGKGVKKALGIADTGIEKILGKIDDKQFNNIKKVAEETRTPIDDIIRQVGGKSDLLGNYKALKKGISSSIDNSKVLGGLVGQARRSANSVDTAEAVSRKIADELDNLSQSTAKKLNIDPNKLSEDISKIIESEQDTTIDGLQWLKKLGADNNTFEGTEKSVSHLKKLIEQKAPDIKFKNSSTATKLVIDTQKSKYLDDFKNNKDIQRALSNMSLKKDLGYTVEERKYLKDLKTKFESNSDLKKVLEEHRKGYSRVADVFEKESGVKLDFARKKGYIRKAQGDLQTDASNVLKSDITGNARGQGLVNTKAFGTREYDVGLVANRQKKEALVKQLGGTVGEDGSVSVGKLQKRQQNLEAKLSENRRVTLEATKKEVSASLEKAKNFNINATKLGEREGKIREAIKNTRNTLVDTQNKLSSSTLKRIENIKDASLHSNFSKHTQDVSKYTKEYNNVIEKMSQKGISEAELKKLTTKSEKLENQIAKVNAQIDGDLVRLNNYVDKKTLTQINQTNNALMKTEALGVRSNKLSEALDKNLTNQKVLKQANQATIDSLEKRLKSIDLQLGSLSPERDALLKEEIAKIEKTKSLLESNEGKELFNLNYHMGMKDFIDQATQYSKGAKVYNDAVLYSTFKNPDYIRVFEDTVKDEAGNLVKQEIPKGFVKIDGTKLQNQFNAVKDLLPEKSSDALEVLGKEFSGNKLIVDKDFANLMNMVGKSKEQAPVLVKLIDGFNNTFKKYKILTPGFQLRNIAGNATNMVLSGMPAGKIPEYYAKATSVLNSADDLLTKVSKGVELTGKDADNWKLLKQFYDGGFDKAGTKLQDLEQLREKVANKKGPLNWLTKKNAKLNEDMDALNRMSLLMYANDNPKYVQKLGKKDAIDAVKYALMDPSNMSDFERNTMKRIVPFYTFTKQNLLYQASNMMKNTPRYNRLMKGLRSIYSNLGENEYYQYQKEGMQIPLPVTDDNGNRLFLKTNLPLSDLGEWMSHPVQRTLSSTSPLIRTPFEMVTGKSIYTGKDNYTSKAEQILSGLGVDTISTNLLKKVEAAVKTYNGDMDSQAMWAEIFRSILQNTNQEKIDTSRAYEDLEAYQSYVKQLKNQGINVPIIRDLNNQSRRTLRSVKNRRNSR